MHAGQESWIPYWSQVEDNLRQSRVKTTKNLANLAGNLASGVKQVGDGGVIYVIRKSDAAFTLDQLKDFVKKFKPQKNVTFEVYDEIDLL